MAVYKLPVEEELNHSFIDTSLTRGLPFNETQGRYIALIPKQVLIAQFHFTSVIMWYICSTKPHTRLQPVHLGCSSIHTCLYIPSVDGSGGGFSIAVSTSFSALFMLDMRGLTELVLGCFGFISYSSRRALIDTSPLRRDLMR